MQHFRLPSPLSYLYCYRGIRHNINAFIISIWIYSFCINHPEVAPCGWLERENQRMNTVGWGDVKIKEWTQLLEGTWKSKNEHSWLRGRENQRMNTVGWGDVKIKEWTKLAEGTLKWKNEQSWLSLEGTWKWKNEQSWLRGRENQRMNKVGWGDVKIKEWTK